VAVPQQWFLKQSKLKDLALSGFYFNYIDARHFDQSLPVSIPSFTSKDIIFEEDESMEIASQALRKPHDLRNLEVRNIRTKHGADAFFRSTIQESVVKLQIDQVILTQSTYLFPTLRDWTVRGSWLWPDASSSFFNFATTQA
jgi:hypothetical protein